MRTWQVGTGTAVRDPRRNQGDVSAASTGGDVGCRYQIAVPGVLTGRAAENPPAGFAHPSLA